jgi:hypothetical protein
MGGSVVNIRQYLAPVAAIALCAVGIAVAQDITNHAIPIGGGPGAVGWKTGGPCTAGQTLVWSSASVDPQCTSVSGSGSTPGGSNGNVQYNNGGTFGGLTDAQLTARIATATSALSGAVPAWPNNVLRFFRGDGTWSALPATISSLNSMTGPVNLLAGAGISISNSAPNITITSSAAHYRPVWSSQR